MSYWHKRYRPEAVCLCAICDADLRHSAPFAGLEPAVVDLVLAYQVFLLSLITKDDPAEEIPGSTSLAFFRALHDFIEQLIRANPLTWAPRAAWQHLDPSWLAPGAASSLVFEKRGARDRFRPLTLTESDPPVLIETNPPVL